MIVDQSIYKINDSMDWSSLQPCSSSNRRDAFEEVGEKIKEICHITIMDKMFSLLSFSFIPSSQNITAWKEEIHLL